MHSTESPLELDAQAGLWLLQCARTAIGTRLGVSVPAMRDRPAAVERIGACFVTLTLDHQLRGCIGTLTAQQPLAEAVAGYACKAAFEDPRFPPLDVTAFEQMAIEVSILTAPKSLSVRSDADLCAQLDAGRDGLIIRDGDRSATFLPQVWQSLPQPARFLAALKQKAGIPMTRDAGTLACEVYRVQAFHEPV